MKCNKCGVEWTTKLTEVNETCPFCGESLNDDIPYKQIINGFQGIVEKFGLEVYAEEKRLYGALSDILPNALEKNILKTVIFLGISKEILEIKKDFSKREEILRKSYKSLENNGLSPSWCAISLYILATPLHIETIDIYPFDAKVNNSNITFVTSSYDMKLEEEYSKKDLDELTRLALNGDAMAQTELGTRYYSGMGVEQDISVAIDYLTQASEAGDCIAEFVIGKLYDEGQYVSQDIKKAIEYYEKSANKGYPEAEYTLGRIYYIGEYVEKNDAEALYWILKAEKEVNDPNFCTTLAMIYKDSIDENVHNEENAFEYAKKAVEMEDAEAYNLLGTLYEIGCGVSQDYKKAAEYYQKAVDNGVEVAYLNLGALYQQGLGVVKDEKKAVEYFQYGVNTGNMYCLNALGMCYKNGTGILKDTKKAFELFLEAAYAGNVAGEVNVAMAYDEGEGVVEDKIEAKKWFTLAAEHGNSKAMTFLGFYKEKGIPDGKIDMKEAFEWYLKAAKVGDYAPVQWIVGNCYTKGLMGVEVDDCVAFEWYLKAAELGHPTAQNNVACEYMKGKIVDLDYECAIEWFEKAVQQDDMYALNNYGMMLFNGWGIQRDINRALDFIKKSAELGYPDAQCNLGICYFEGWGIERNIDESLKWLLLAYNAGMEKAKEYLQKEFKERKGTWIKKGLFGHISKPKPLPPVVEAMKCDGGCDNYCDYAKLGEQKDLEETRKFCYCELLNKKVFRKNQCPYFKNTTIPSWMMSFVKGVDKDNDN